MARVRAVLFDIDGTLLDSNDAHAHAWLDSLRGHGRNVPFEQLRSRIGMGGDKLLPEVAGIDAESELGQSINDRRIAILKAHYLPELAPFPGARLLVDRLRARGLVCAAVSSSTASDIGDLLRAAGVADLIEHVISSDDADRSKPDPDLIRIALERVDVAPDEAVLIGDSPYDVEAGVRAGVPVIALRCGGFPERDLDGATAVFDGPQDLATKIEASPIVLERTSQTIPTRRRRPARAAVY
jgi:HAD superfamily hydrolase (TIGR01509 family)